MKIPRNKEEILQMIWANGGNSPAVIVYHNEGDSGYLECPAKLINSLGIAGKLSAYSKKDKHCFYLYSEFDDMLLFFNALKFIENNLVQVFWECVVKEYYNEESYIHRLQSC